MTAGLTVAALAIAALACGGGRAPVEPEPMTIVASVAPDAAVADAVQIDAAVPIDAAPPPECEDLGSVEGRFVAEKGERLTLTICVTRAWMTGGDVDPRPGKAWAGEVVVRSGEREVARQILMEWDDDYWAGEDWTLWDPLRGKDGDAIVLRRRWRDESEQGEEVRILGWGRTFTTLWSASGVHVSGDFSEEQGAVIKVTDTDDVEHWTEVELRAGEIWEEDVTPRKRKRKRR